MLQLSPLFYQDDQNFYISRPPKLFRWAEAFLIVQHCIDAIGRVFLTVTKKEKVGICRLFDFVVLILLDKLVVDSRDCSVPEGRLSVAQDDSPGFVQLRPKSPVGTTESYPGTAPVIFEPSLRDSSCF